MIYILYVIFFIILNYFQSLQDVFDVYKRYSVGHHFWTTFLLVLLADELVTINATPIRITIIAMRVIAVIFSCNIAQPNKTAITGLT